MTKRLIILLLTLAVGFGATFALPKQFKIRPTAMPGNKVKRSEFGGMTLPTIVGSFVAGPSLPAGEKEREVLASDTGFSKRQYTRRNYNHRTRETLDQQPKEGNQELITASVVTAGSDMGNSIHRPERCMVAQGFNLAPSQAMLFEADGRKISVTKIQSSRPMKTMLKDGTEVNSVNRSVLYYWFVGNNYITGSHYKRTLKDFSDRLSTGTDQEWAYASVTIPLDALVTPLETANPKDEPTDFVSLHKVDDETKDGKGLTEVDRMAQEFITEFVKDVIDSSMINEWNP